MTLNGHDDCCVGTDTRADERETLTSRERRPAGHRHTRPGAFTLRPHFQFVLLYPISRGRFLGVWVGPLTNVSMRFLGTQLRFYYDIQCLMLQLVGVCFDCAIYRWTVETERFLVIDSSWCSVRMHGLVDLSSIHSIL